MENASKALIIAGAILISILLISVGVLIMNSTGDTQDTVESNAEQIAKRSFNSNFTPYEGEGQSAAQVRALRSAVNASNGSTDTPSSITMYIEGTSIKSSQKYTVELEYANGYVSKIYAYINSKSNATTTLVSGS